MKSLILAALLATTPALAALPTPPKPPAQTLAQACAVHAHPPPGHLLALACAQIRRDTVVVQVLGQRLTAAQNDAIGWQVMSASHRH